MLSRLTLLAVPLLLSSPFATAGSIIYTSVYHPTELPATSPGSPGALYWSPSAAGTSSATALGGVLSVDTMPAIATTRAWSIG